MKKIIKLSEKDIEHILSVLEINKRNNCYCGDANEFWERDSRVCRRLNKENAKNKFVLPKGLKSIGFKDDLEINNK